MIITFISFSLCAFKQGVDYPAGSCAYRDSYSDRPWCRIAASGIFAGASGILNWDFCDDQCGNGRVATII